MIPPLEFLRAFIQPALEWINLDSTPSRALLLGTAITESRLTDVFQLSGGPARGFFQMEPATAKDINDNFLVGEFRQHLAIRVRNLMLPWMTIPEALVSCPLYAAAMCRVHYLRNREPLPDANKPDAMGAYWKAHYNTPLGAGSARHFAMLYEQHVLPILTVF